MKNKKIWIGIGVVLLIGVMVTLAVLKNKGDVITAKTTKLSPDTMSETIMASGTLASDKQQTVYLEPERGSVKKIEVKAGDKVKKGDPLVKYENPALAAERKQAELGLERVKVQRSNLYAALEEAKKQTEEEAALSGATGQSTDQIERELKLVNVEVKQMEDSLQQVKNQQAKLAVTSEQAGVVVSVHSIASAANTASPLVVVADLEKLKVEAQISELEAIKVKEKQRATIQSDALPGEEWGGTVTLVGLTPESKSAVGEGSSQVEYPVEIKLDEPVPAKLGSRLIVEIATTEKEVNTLPETAVLQRDEKQVVFVVKGQSAIEKQIEIGLAQEGKIEIIDGVGTDEQVIIEPPEDLKSGTEVKSP
ncbi:efflux RND transporter periplasmic adaptor subunit [Mechercharimyces sp. CAU 1602]|uniref:efflux RND transporter periplasmic adaptor subunit n=1 Tax=Mechercharimyces sp. CAU 1602 TaxID=2973933 RepID=UPI002163BAEA|nr:efflux RND transporter periplasmic adaptor subunit [Mechercharimyces sp. CAU 1602]MCS1352469.1 efflux RND transporter periplasmic adaptor subunit [Mechercharimyces sp. CAU 1602]